MSLTQKIIFLATMSTVCALTTTTALSTHVLDTTRGTPAHNLAISLCQQTETQWQTILSGSTNDNGRLNFEQKLNPGVYKLHFEVADYYKSQKLESIFPFVEVVFSVTPGTPSLHIPLLLTPFSYTTYRGS